MLILSPRAMARSPFSVRDFRFYWTARVASSIGQVAMVVVIGWQVYDIARLTMSLKGAALQLGIVGAVQFVPLFALTLVSGWTADRLDRRMIAGATFALEVGCAIALGWLSWHGTNTLTALFLVAAVLGVARAFSAPALSALAPNLVPRTILPKAIAMSSIAWQIGAVAGPALGGYLYALAPAIPYAMAAILFCLALACMVMIHPAARSPIQGSQQPWAQMIDGLKYVRRNRLVLGAISLDLFAVLLGGATAMLPIYARDILQAGPTGLGHLRAAPAVGAAIIALWFSFSPLKRNVGVKMLAAVIVFGAATIVFGVSRSMPLSLLCLVLLGAADMLSVYVRHSLIQLHTPDAMRGRVSAVSTLFISASNELGEAESGFLAALIGPVAAIIAGGIGAIAVTLLWARLFPEIRLARNFNPPDPDPESTTRVAPKETLT